MIRDESYLNVELSLSLRKIVIVLINFIIMLMFYLYKLL
jgi:hypothetical protein